MIKENENNNKNKSLLRYVELILEWSTCNFMAEVLVTDPLHNSH